MKEKKFVTTIDLTADELEQVLHFIKGLRNESDIQQLEGGESN